MANHPLGRFWLLTPWLLLLLGAPLVIWWMLEPAPLRIEYVHPHFLTRPAMSRDDASTVEVLAVNGNATIFRYVEYCVSRPFEGTSHRAWVGKALVWHAPDLPTMLSRVPGCFAANLAVEVPTSSPTRTFSYVQTISIPLNPLRTETIEYAPIPLTILDSKDK
jgi:hypothetical protein